jgi:hypothetical protein
MENNMATGKTTAELVEVYKHAQNQSPNDNSYTPPYADPIYPAPYPNYPIYPTPCPGCGRCPCCGRGGHYYQPFIYMGGLQQSAPNTQAYNKQ